MRWMHCYFVINDPYGSSYFIHVYFIENNICKLRTDTSNRSASCGYVFPFSSKTSPFFLSVLRFSLLSAETLTLKRGLSLTERSGQLRTKEMNSAIKACVSWIMIILALLTKCSGRGNVQAEEGRVVCVLRECASGAVSRIETPGSAYAAGGDCNYSAIMFTLTIRYAGQPSLSDLGDQKSIQRCRAGLYMTVHVRDSHPSD